VPLRRKLGVAENWSHDACRKEERFLTPRTPFGMTGLGMGAGGMGIGYDARRRKRRKHRK